MKLIPLRASRVRNVDGDAEMLHLSLGAALGHGPDARLVIDAQGHVIKANKAAALIADALDDRSSEAAKTVREWADDDYLGPVSLNVPDGQLARRFTLHAIPILRQNGEDAAILIGREPDLANHLMQAMSASRQLYKDLVQCAGAMAWEVDAKGRFSYLNGSTDLGYDPLELMGECPAHALGLDAQIADKVFLAKEPLHEAELWPLCKNGERACLVVSATPLFDAEGQWLGCRGMARNVTMERTQADALAKARDTLAQLALSDDLTNLLNRRAFDEQLGVRLHHAIRTGRSGALLLIDLDHFKKLNDNLGHAAGDQALIKVGDVLEKSLRVGDLAARLGGDEFGVWLEDTGEEGACATADRLQSQLEGFSFSIGIALSQSGEALAALKERADKALYRAKEKGRATYALAEGAK